MPDKKILSLSAMDKLMKSAGAYRVGEDAKEALREVLEEIGAKISIDADNLSKKAGRVTIKAEDILAVARTKEKETKNFEEN
jgi:histone H3/H4